CICSTNGKVTISGKQLITNQPINSIIPNKKIHYYFLFNILKHRAGRIKLLAANQAVPILNKSEFSKIKLPIPPLPEQKAIADCLSTWDRAIEKQTQLIHAKKEFKKGLMQGFFNGQLTVNNGQLIKAKKGEDFTKDWEIVRLGDIAKIVRGGSPRPISEYITNSFDGLNWLKIGDIDKDAMFIHRTEERIKPEGLKNTRLVKSGELILSNSMSFGRPFILKIDTCIHDGWLAITNIN